MFEAFFVRVKMRLNKLFGGLLFPLMLLVSSCSTPNNVEYAGDVFSAKLVSYAVLPKGKAISYGSAKITLGADLAQTRAKLSISNLEGNVTGIYIFGPARIGQNGSPIIRLSGDETNFVINREQFLNLRAGLLYISVMTDKYPEGELRGQLISEF
jgi:hypothetical protein